MFCKHCGEEIDVNHGAEQGQAAFVHISERADELDADDDHNAEPAIGTSSPGPWHENIEQDDGNNPGICVTDRSGNVLCDIGGGDFETRLANARLMAASHQFLWLARRILERCEWDSGTRHQFADGKSSLSGCSLTVDDIQIVVQLIARVDGVEPEVCWEKPATS